VVHVEGSVDPIRDIEVIDTELALADLEAVTKKHKQIEKQARSGDKEASARFGVLEKVKAALDDGKPVRSVPLSNEELDLIYDLHLITSKKTLYLCNVDDSDLGNPDSNAHVRAVKARAETEGASVVVICGKIESEIAELPEEDKIAFLKDYGMEEPGLNRVIHEGYQLLGLQTYFTAGVQEVRAWTIQKGWKAPQAAGVIHTDFERGFIKAEVYTVSDMEKYKSAAAIREAGCLRLEGKEYVVQDGDVILFRFNV